MPPNFPCFSKAATLQPLQIVKCLMPPQLSMFFLRQPKVDAPVVITLLHFCIIFTCVLETTIHKQTQIMEIRHELSYKQLEVKTNRTLFLCGNRNGYHNTEQMSNTDPTKTSGGELMCSQWQSTMYKQKRNFGKEINRRKYDKYTGTIFLPK